MKRSRHETTSKHVATATGPPLAAADSQPHQTHQTSLKDHFRVVKAPRHAGKENAPRSGVPVVVSPPAKAHKMPFGTKHTAAQQQQPPAFGSFSFMLPPAAAPAPQAAAAPVMSEGGVSLSTAQFEFPAPSEDTAGGAGEITSNRLPSGFGTAAGGIVLQRMARPAHTLSTAADPDDEILSRRLMPLPALPARLPTRSTSAATFSSGVQPMAACQPEYSTASLASWLPGCQGTSSMQQGAAACAAEESDCEDDAVSQRWPGLASAPTTVGPAPQAPQLSGSFTGPAAGTGGSSRLQLASAPASTPTAVLCCPVSGSEESEGGAITGTDTLPLALELGQGGGAAVHNQEAARVVYHTRLEELLFGMSYVAPSAADGHDGAEE